MIFAVKTIGCTEVSSNEIEPGVEGARNELDKEKRASGKGYGMRRSEREETGSLEK